MTETRTITLAASGSLTIAARGKVVAIVSSTAGFDLRLGNGSPVGMNAGRVLGSAASKTIWKSLTFIDTSGSANTITFTFGDEDIKVETAVTTAVTTSISNSIANCIAATPTQLLKTTTVAASPAVVAASATYFRKAIIYAVKTLAGAVNTSDVNLGFSGTASQQPILIPPGGEYTLEPPNGAKWNLADLYLTVATNGDGVVILYT